MTRLSIIIPTRNRRDGILRCLTAVLADAAASEVVVVDDGSIDGTVDAIRGRFSNEKRIRVLEEQARGQYSAQQRGAAVASGDAILFLDDDVELAAGTVLGHARHHQQGNVDVVVGYMPCNIEGLTPEQWPVLHYSRQYERKVALWERDESKVLAHLWGGNVSIGTKAFRKLPPYPGEPLSYHIDWEFGLRCRWAGLRALFDRSLRSIHHQKRELEGFLRDRRRSAADRLAVHAVYRDRLGPLPLEHFTQDCSPATRWVVEQRSLESARICRAAWAAQLRVAHRAHAWSWERRSALDLTSLEGVVDTLRADHEAGHGSGT